jgi:hypothetical protein
MLAAAARLPCPCFILHIHHTSLCPCTAVHRALPSGSSCSVPRRLGRCALLSGRALAGSARHRPPRRLVHGGPDSRALGSHHALALQTTQSGHEGLRDTAPMAHNWIVCCSPDATRRPATRAPSLAHERPSCAPLPRRSFACPRHCEPLLLPQRPPHGPLLWNGRKRPAHLSAGSGDYLTVPLVSGTSPGTSPSM